MSEIGTLSLERLNNGAHFLFISNVLARAEADANVKSKLSAQIVSLKAAMEQEDEDLKISQKSTTCTGGYDRILSCKLNADSAIP